MRHIIIYDSINTFLSRVNNLGMKIYVQMKRKILNNHLMILNNDEILDEGHFVYELFAFIENSYIESTFLHSSFRNYCFSFCALSV